LDLWNGTREVRLKMAKTVRVALVGYGYWGPNYARIFNELPESQVAAICEVDHERRQRAQMRHPQVESSSDVKEVLRRNDVDGVVISTPATTHFDLAQEALRSGRHVLVEKPLALTIEHCERLCELAERTGRVLMVAHTFLYNAGIRKMKECMQSADFGRAYYLHATRTNLGPIRKDVNAVWDLAPHDISIFNYLLDQQPQWASAIGTPVLGSSREDVGFVTLGYANGVIGNIHVSWADPNKVRAVVAVGSGRRVVFDDLNDAERIRVYEKGVSVGEMDADSFGEFKLLVRDGDIISPKIIHSEPLKNQCAEFITSITHSTQPLSDARFGAAVVRTLLAIEASMGARGAAKEI
jgi:predicted dehydrogenase